MKVAVDDGRQGSLSLGERVGVRGKKLLELPLHHPTTHGSWKGDLFLSWLCVLAIAITGCTTKSAAKAQAQAAYSAGQQQALERALQSRNSVTILGPVRNPLVPWTEDLTLAKVLVAADYYPKTNPREIFIVRQGRALPVDVNHLLGGEDVPLQAGDVVNIR